MLPINYLIRWISIAFYLGATSAALMSFFAPEPFKRLFFKTGKLSHLRSSASAGKDELKAKTKLFSFLPTFLLTKVPKSRFTLFYLVGSVLNIMIVSQILRHSDKYRLSQNFFIWLITELIYQVHLFRRLFECLYVHRFSPKSEMLLGHFILGLLFYTLTPLSFVNYLYISNDPAIRATYLSSSLEPMLKQSIEVLVLAVGLSLSLFGNWKQYECHKILADLRRPFSEKKNADNSSAYRVIPQRAMFETLTCPHYTCEILIYVGLIGMLTWFSDLALNCCMIWIFVNLLLQSLDTFQWYLLNADHFEFEQLPKSDDSNSPQKDGNDMKKIRLSLRDLLIPYIL